MYPSPLFFSLSHHHSFRLEIVTRTHENAPLTWKQPTSAPHLCRWGRHTWHACQYLYMPVLSFSFFYLPSPGIQTQYEHNNTWEDGFLCDDEDDTLMTCHGCVHKSIFLFSPLSPLSKR